MLSEHRLADRLLSWPQLKVEGAERGPAGAGATRGDAPPVRTLIGAKGSGLRFFPPPGWLFWRHFFNDLWLTGVVREQESSSPKAESLSFSTMPLNRPDSGEREEVEKIREVGELYL